MEEEKKRGWNRVKCNGRGSKSEEERKRGIEVTEKMRRERCHRERRKEGGGKEGGITN